MRVLSLGWGVQSFTLAAMAALGELEPLDAAIHADTTHERTETYALAAETTGWLEQHGVPIVTVRANEIDLEQIPAYTAEGGRLDRQCPVDWKVMPVRRWLQQHRAGQPVEMWLGISLDEAVQRAKSSPVKYIVNRFPLVEMEMTRLDCPNWLEARHLPIPVKSSCVFCPFHNQRTWNEMKAAGGANWQAALAADAEVEARFGRYVHRYGKSLAEAVDIPEDHGYVQTSFDPEGKCDEAMCWV